MNIRRRWLMLALLVSVVALVGFFAPATLAYVTAQSNTMVNTFTAPAVTPQALEVRVHKTVLNIGKESIGPEGFRFILRNTANGEAVTLTTDASGYAAVTLPLADASLGKTYTFHLSEVNDGRADVTYSTQIYVIQATFSVDAQGQTVTSLRMNGMPVERVVAEFENIYGTGMDIPDTGDDAELLLWAAMMLLSGAGMVYLLSKRCGVRG